MQLRMSATLRVAQRRGVPSSDMAGRSSWGNRTTDVTAVERGLAGMAQAIGLAIFTEE